VLARGDSDTKIADIAAEADIGVGTFYLHFETKDALFDALVDDTVRRLKAAVDEALAASGPVERLRSANDAFCRFAGKPEVFRVVFSHAAAYHDVIQRAQDLFAAASRTSVTASPQILRPFRPTSPRGRRRDGDAGPVVVGRLDAHHDARDHDHYRAPRALAPGRGTTTTRR
jgi:AcrR family transcriptional regulator